jgi:hypothetical protein
MDISDVAKHLPVISVASHEMLQMFGAKFTNTPKGHIETDISAAASLAGLLILRSKFPVLPSAKPGTLFLSPMEAEMNLIMNFVAGMCKAGGIDPSGGWDTIIPDANKPLYSIPDMTRKIEGDFLALCGKHNLEKEYYPFVAALGSLRLVSGGNRSHILDQNIGKALIWYHIYGGARTIPYP